MTPGCHGNRVLVYRDEGEREKKEKRRERLKDSEGARGLLCVRGSGAAKCFLKGSEWFHVRVSL